MKYVSLLIGLAGLGVVIWLFSHEGVPLILQTFAAAGWGVVIVSAIHILHMIMAGIGWQALWPSHRHPPIKLFVWVLWIREAVNALLPVARIGGEVAALHILRRNGLPMSSAIGSLVVETTLSVVTTFAFVLFGLFLLSWRVPEHGYLLQIIVGLAVSLAIIGALVALQKFGAFQLGAKIVNLFAGNKFTELANSGRKMDKAVAVFYARPSRALACSLWSFFAWWVGALEIWAALYFLGHPVGFSTGLILEAMIMATGSAAFFVPASLGVQEGTFWLFGQMLGIPREVCLALALVRRSRDVLLLAPGLVLWQIQEGRRLFRRAPETA